MREGERARASRPASQTPLAVSLPSVSTNVRPAFPERRGRVLLDWVDAQLAMLPPGDGAILPVNGFDTDVSAGVVGRGRGEVGQRWSQSGRTL